MFPPFYLTWGQTMVEVMKMMVTSFRRSHACTAAVIAPSPAAGHHPPTPALETPGHSQASLGQSLAGSLLLSPGSWCAQDFVYAFQEVALWWGNGDLFQEGLCHIQVYCTQSLCLCSSPLLTCTSAGDMQTQLCLIFCGVSGFPVQFSHSVTSNFLLPHGLQHARLLCPSPTPGACTNSCPLNQ